jgi:hypothetical protein
MANVLFWQSAPNCLEVLASPGRFLTKLPRETISLDVLSALRQGSFRTVSAPPRLYWPITVTMPATQDSPPRPRTTPSVPTRQPLRHRSRTYSGRAQLSLAEHALCPLDAGESLGGPYIHETAYAYSDVNRHRKKAHVPVTCPDGLSPADEFYLWGLLSLAFSQPNTFPESSPIVAGRYTPVFLKASTTKSKSSSEWLTATVTTTTSSSRTERHVPVGLR